MAGDERDSRRGLKLINTSGHERLSFLLERIARRKKLGVTIYSFESRRKIDGFGTRFSIDFLTMLLET